MNFLKDMPVNRITKIWIHENVIDDPLTQRVMKCALHLPHEILTDTEIRTRLQKLDLKSGKKVLLLQSESGGLVKPCPATLPPYLCCQYTVINQLTQCPMDCTYCVLQGYLESPVITLNTRLTDVLDEINLLQSDEPKRFYRIGTGELGDSLALDSLTYLTDDFLRFFRQRKNALIELKTKSVEIDRLMQHDPSHAVISWSVNPQTVVALQELHAMSIDERLQAARRCADHGYLIGFHFDPIWHYPNWPEEYAELVHKLFEAVDPSRVAWISLGSLRFPPAFRDVVLARFPGSNLLNTEMIRGLDGKMRYPRPLRIEMFRAIYDAIRKLAPEVFVYFCMEHPNVWDRVMGKHPEDNAELDYRFAESLYKRFGSELEMDAPLLEYYSVVK